MFSQYLVKGVINIFGVNRIIMVMIIIFQAHIFMPGTDVRISLALINFHDNLVRGILLIYSQGQWISKGTESESETRQAEILR